MKTLDKYTENNILTATILIEAGEFDAALKDAYQCSKEKFTSPGRQEGMVLFDEALDICIPKLYAEFLRENGIVPSDQPEITDVSWPGAGSVTFTVQVPVLPKVSPDQYKGIAVKVPAGDKASFSEAVMREAAGRMEVSISETIVDQKLNAMLAEQKLHISQDPVYNVLADMVEILRKAYIATGITRSMAQVRSEAMDIMLQNLSKDQKEPSREHLYFLLKETVKGYRELPAGFDHKLDQILEERKQKTLEMTPEERAAEAYNAYLGSLDITEEGWLKMNMEKAVLYAKFDLLLDAVGEAESIVVTPEELEEAFVELGRQCGIGAEQVKASVDGDILQWKLKRDKARKLILESAVSIA